MALLYPIETIASWTAEELSKLPSAEDESHEFKSSRIPLADLRKEVGLAATAFWNTGGGLFVAGVDGTGRSDGGVELSVGRQPLRDWIDQCLADVSPRGEYRVATVNEPALNLPANRGILLIVFGESHLAPHMAPDRRYYIRAGAHTVPAPHFVVEALMARRGLTQPLLRPMLRQKAGIGYVVQLGIVAATPTPALDVKIELTEPPPYLRRGTPVVTIQVGVISPEAPFFFDFHVLTMGSQEMQPFPVKVEYSDAAGRRYTAAFEIDLASQLGVTLAGETGNRDIVKQLDDIESVLKNIGTSIKNNEQHLRTIAGKIR